MLRKTPEERLSASACLTKGYDVGLFDGHYVDSGSVTPRQTVLQGKIGDDNGSTTILLDALWDTVGESPDHNDNSRTGHSIPNHTFRALESRNLRAPSSPSNREGHDSRLGSFRPGFDRQSSNVQSPIDRSCSLEAGSKYLGGYKRRQSKAVGSAKKSSSKERIKRRPRGSLAAFAAPLRTCAETVAWRRTCPQDPLPSQRFERHPRWFLGCQNLQPSIEFLLADHTVDFIDPVDTVGYCPMDLLGLVSVSFIYITSELCP